MKQIIAFLCLVAVASAQESTEAPPTEVPTSTQTPSTANPGLPYGSYCNGLLLRCNRYSETVACLQRRPEPTTIPTEAPPATSEDPIIATFFQKKQEPGREVCETGIGVDLGKCQCRRNCKEGIYVDDGEFDADREICVGLVGSTCSLLVPNCVANGQCNFLTSKCVCKAGFVDDGNRRCVAA